MTQPKSKLLTFLRMTGSNTELEVKGKEGQDNSIGLFLN